MFLRNFDNLLIGLVGLPWATNTNYNYDSGGASCYIGQTGQFGDGNVNMRSSNGTANVFRPYPASSNMHVLTLSKSNIVLGTGDTEVTHDDYKMSGSVISSSPLVYQSYQINFDADLHRYTKCATHTYSNTTSNDITIREWGMWWYPNTSTNLVFNNNTSNHYLLYREVLDEPIVIKAGTTATLTFEVEFPMMHRI